MDRKTADTIRETISQFDNPSDFDDLIQYALDRKRIVLEKQIPTLTEELENVLLKIHKQGYRIRFVNYDDRTSLDYSSDCSIELSTLMTYGN